MKPELLWLVAMLSQGHNFELLVTPVVQLSCAFLAGKTKVVCSDDANKEGGDPGVLQMNAGPCYH